MGTLTIKLDAPVTAFERSHDTIVLKEPTGGLYARLGEPRLPVYNEKTGHGYFIEQPDIISQYLDRLVDVGDSASSTVVLSSLSLTDMKRVKAALFSFFDEAAAKAVALKWTPSFSGSNA